VVGDPIETIKTNETAAGAGNAGCRFSFCIACFSFFIRGGVNEK
jgi:hypothetical protein